MRIVTGVARGAAYAALSAIAWATLIEPRCFVVRNHTIPALPVGAAPVRVLHLSDLHLAPWQHRKIDWVRRLATLEVDLVVLTGDLFGHRFAREALVHALHPLADERVRGVFVHGSNDYFSPIVKNPLGYVRTQRHTHHRSPDLDTVALTRSLTELGFTDLNNQATTLTLRGTEFELFGLNDPHIGYDDAAQMAAARATLPAREQTEPVRVGVVHAPYRHALDTLLEHRAELIFAGHTHGGQVRLPGVGALTANCDLPLHQARGLSVWHDAEHAAFLNVSAGLGASIYAPLRFACRPEASLLTLEAVRAA